MVGVRRATRLGFLVGVAASLIVVIADRGSSALLAVLSFCGVALASVLPAWFFIERFLRRGGRHQAGRFVGRALVGPLLVCALGTALLSSEGVGILAACALAPVLPTILVILLVALGRPHPAALAASAVLPLATLWAPGWFAQSPDELRWGMPRAKTDRWLPVEFGFRRGSQNFLILSPRDLPLPELLLAAEAANALACSTLGLDDPDRECPLPIYLCETKAELSSLERALVGPLPDPRREDWRYAGVYYRTVPMIALAVPEERLVKSIPHEVVHSVVARVTQHCPGIVEEGLADYLSELVLDRDDDTSALLEGEQSRKVGGQAASRVRSWSVVGDR